MKTLSDSSAPPRPRKPTVLVETAVLDSPYGPCFFAAIEARVAWLEFTGARDAEACQRDLARSWPDATFTAGGSALATLFDQTLDAWRTGRESDIALALRGTPLQARVWTALREIPHGETRSYGQIASQIGKPRAVRAVASAIGRNPVCLIVPCHRVLRADGGLGGYRCGLAIKTALMAEEAAA